MNESTGEHPVPPQPDDVDAGPVERFLTAEQAAGRACALCGYRLAGSIPLHGWSNALTGQPITPRSCLTCATPEELAEATVTFSTAKVCALCERDAVDPVTIGRWASASGPGWAQYACRSCAEEKGCKVLGD